MPAADDKSTSPRNVAILIANECYDRPDNRQPHALSNANDMEAKLKPLKFDVTKKLNVEKEMLKEISLLARSVEKGDRLVLYYTGGCRQVNGQNYLIPVDDSKISAAKDIADLGCSVSDVLDILTKKQPQFCIVILDCYKPYLCKKENAQSPGQGLCAMTAAENTLIAFACGANQVVTDTSTPGRENLFVKCLLDHIGKPNIGLADLFHEVAKDVSDRSSGHQTPLIIENLGKNRDYCLNEVKHDKNGNVDDMINDCNKYIRDLQLELEELTLLGPMYEGASYNRKIGKRIGHIKALIHELKLDRKNLIGGRYAGPPSK